MYTSTDKEQRPTWPQIHRAEDSQHDLGQSSPWGARVLETDSPKLDAKVLTQSEFAPTQLGNDLGLLESAEGQVVSVSGQSFRAESMAGSRAGSRPHSRAGQSSSAPVPLQLGDALVEVQSPPGQFRHMAGPGSGPRSRAGQSSDASGSMQLRDSIAGLLHSEHCSSQPSSDSHASAAHFVGFGTASEQITSPGLIKSVVTDASGQIKQQQGPATALKGHFGQPGLLQLPQGGLKVPLEASMGLQTPFEQRLAEQKPSCDISVHSRHAQETENVGLDAVGPSSQPRQLQMPSASQQGDGLLSQGVSEAPAESPSYTSRFKQVETQTCLSNHSHALVAQLQPFVGHMFCGTCFGDQLLVKASNSKILGIARNLRK